MDITERFTKELFVLNPPDSEHSFNATLSNLERVLKRKELSIITGYIVTFDDILETYTKYFNWWKKKYGSRDPRFVGKADKQQEIYVFLDKKGWNKNYEHLKTERDFYLFGNMSEKKLRKSLKEFLK